MSSGSGSGACGNADGEVCCTVRENFLVTAVPPESVALSSKEKVPVAVGVPCSVTMRAVWSCCGSLPPPLLGAWSVIPAGRAPLDTDHVSGATPPTATIGVVYEKLVLSGFFRYAVGSGDGVLMRKWTSSGDAKPASHCSLASAGFWNVHVVRPPSASSMKKRIGPGTRRLMRKR